MSDLTKLVNLTSKWSEDRNLIKGSTAKDQTLKLIQEVGELSDSICKGKSPVDDIGDCLVVLNNLALQHGLTLSECLEHSYNDIKDRKGIMKDGIFIKEADLSLENMLESSLEQMLESSCNFKKNTKTL